MNPFLGIAFVLMLLVNLLASMAFGSRRFCWPAELTRKTAHILIGLTTVSFPWIFKDIWPVWVICFFATAILWRIRRGSDFWRAALNRVDRASYGEMVYPVSVALVFTLAERDPILFCIPILVLALADAAGAIVGMSHGRLMYLTFDGRKSVEGSLAVAGVTFAIVYVPLVACGLASSEAALLTALLIALAATIVEALSMKGLDNLFLPIVVFCLLSEYRSYTVGELLVHLSTLILAFLGVWLLRREGRLKSI